MIPLACVNSSERVGLLCDTTSMATNVCPPQGALLSLSIFDQDGSYPRPQLRRTHWRDLSGVWSFRFGDGLESRLLWRQTWPDESGEIIVPLPPESPASGIADTAFHDQMWYARTIGAADLEAAGYVDGMRLVLHFGAVDYRCRVWVDEHRVGEHEGGQSPFCFDITDALADRAIHRIVVWAQDDPTDAAQPRGKQDWRESPHAIWYHRTSGIWQPVWLEAIPATAIGAVSWVTNPRSAVVTANVTMTRKPDRPQPLTISLAFRGKPLACVSTTIDQIENTIPIHLPDLVNGMALEDLLWSPEQPRLIDAEITYEPDVVYSYFGIRTAEVAAGCFLLNNLPYAIRGVLSQGYWPDSHLAAPSVDALRAEVQLIKDLGFNTARLHQKYEDPRLLSWADRLGVLVWAEAPAAYAFTPLAVERTVREWLDIVVRDRSHPSIVTWVPFNESWGIQQAAHDQAQRDFEQGVVHLTRALDPTRPIVANDGWEQVETDIIAIHDYRSQAETMRSRYRDRAAVEDLLRGLGPEGRPLVLGGDVAQACVMLTEFGGIAFDPDQDEDGWGYISASSAADYASQLAELFSAVRDSRILAGFCYTQLTDTAQEVNGLVRANREPKLSIDQMRTIVTGEVRA